MTRWALAGCTALAAVGAAAVLGVAPATADETDIVSTVVDVAGDAWHGYDPPAFQDIVSGRITKKANGDFEVLMEVAGEVPANPTMPRPAHAEIWWAWDFDLDPTTSPKGYPAAPGVQKFMEILVHVSWNGAEFAGTAIDRRPLLTGGEAIVTPIEFEVDGTSVKAVVPHDLIGDVPSSFDYLLATVDWGSQVGTSSYHVVDNIDLATFND